MLFVWVELNTRWDSRPETLWLLMVKDGREQQDYPFYTLLGRNINTVRYSMCPHRQENLIIFFQHKESWNKRQETIATKSAQLHQKSSLHCILTLLISGLNSDLYPSLDPFVCTWEIPWVLFWETWLICFLDFEMKIHSHSVVFSPNLALNNTIKFLNHAAKHN